MSGVERYELHIDAFSPATIPMARLSEYMAASPRCSGTRSTCVSRNSLPVARRLAQHIFGPPVRLRGRGTWSRAESGDWKLHRFDIESFVVLDETPLSKLFDGLRTRLAPAEGERQNPIDLMQQLREE